MGTPRNIAIIIPKFPCISETFIVNHITGLLDSGHKIAIYALAKNSISDQKHSVIDEYKLLNKTKYLKNIPSNKMLRHLFTALFIAVFALRFPVKLYKALKYLITENSEDFYLNLYFFFLIVRDKIDIYHFHFGHVGRLSAFLKEVGFTQKMVTSFHGYDINKIPLQKPNGYYNMLFERGDHFIANSTFTKNQLLNLGCCEKKISIIPVGLHIKDYHFKKRVFPQKGPVKILTIARLVEKKGHKYSISAIAKLIKEGFDIHYTIAGDGTLKSELHALAKDLEISKNITFTGAITQQEAVKLYDQSHLFVLASVTASDGDKEGQGLVLQEAQACGLPVISTLHNGIPDGVLDGKSGYLVPEKDINALSEAIKKLLLNPSLWPQMGISGRDLIIHKYEMSILIPQLIDLYK